MTEDRDSGELTHKITHEEAEELIASLSSVLETLERVERDAENQKEETERRDIARAADTTHDGPTPQEDATGATTR